MGVHRIELPRHEHPFIGNWHIYSMELWDESYFNMETQAFIEIRPENLGSFQFRSRQWRARWVPRERKPPKQRFVFTWEGNDEMDPVTGSGWLTPKDQSELLGSVKFHLGDRSRFRARRAG